MYNRWAETSRVNWVRGFAVRHDTQHAAEWGELWTPRGHGLILKSITTEFKFPVHYPDSVTVLHRLAAPPAADTETFQLEVVVLSERHQRRAARCLEECVLYDYVAGRKAPLGSRPFVVDAFSRAWDLQERERAGALALRADLERAVRALETASWDRADAKEDFGGAA